MYFGIHIIFFFLCFYFMHTEKRKTYDLIVYVCYCKTAESARTYTSIGSGFILLFLLKNEFFFVFSLSILFACAIICSILFCKYVLQTQHTIYFQFEKYEIK